MGRLAGVSDSGKLLLIDGHSVAYRAFFALPVENFATTTGQHTNAVFGFTSMLINVLRDEQPTHLIVAFDVARESFRTEQYPEYKANRSKSPDEFKGQVALVKDVLDALNIPYLEKPGYEADDIIASLSTKAEAEGYDVFIVTGDRCVIGAGTLLLGNADPDGLYIGQATARAGIPGTQLRSI